MLIKVFYIACEKVCGDSLVSLRFPCMLRQQSVFDILLLGFQQYLYAHLYFAFRLCLLAQTFMFHLQVFCFITICIIVQPVMSCLEVHLLYMKK